MKIIIETQDAEKQLDMDKITVKELLKKLKINPVTVIVARNDTLVTEKEILRNKDTIKIMSVVSGG